ncbi:MAG: STAS domain-containing protein [Ignavibacteriaceae bacterium]
MENFELEIVDGVAVVKVNIAAATLRDAQSLWALFENELIFEWKKIIIDLSFCTFIDSTFIGMIVKLYKRANQNRNCIKLVFPQITGAESFRMSGISRIMECFNTLQNAVESYITESPVSKIVIEHELFTS